MDYKATSDIIEKQFPQWEKRFRSDSDYNRHILNRQTDDLEKRFEIYRILSGTEHRLKSVFDRTLNDL
jgi:hypothetical protein